MQTITPNQTGSISNDWTSGSKIGSAISRTEIQSRMNPRMKMITRNMMITPVAVSSRSLTMPSTSVSPPTRMKTLVNMTPPTTIIITMDVTLTVRMIAS